ncbi:tetratricopeptide repeat protein [Leadbetterella sp. DM7]|uniref:tetratricopeptide repeat protein n=1 Tax=Leadbetterella sp. DM7 TaxID=3235085 RepID=UPI00349EA671
MKDYVIRYQNANQSMDEVVENFIVRKKEYEDTINSIQSAKEGDSFSHLVFVGRRGSGKSTLLRRIQAGILHSDSLSLRYEVVNLSEEQSGVYRFFDLWDYVIRDLNSQGYSIQEPDFRLYKENLKTYSKDLHALIINALRSRNKRLILLIDNIDRIFDNIGEDVALFRELLMNFKEIRIIGGSTVMSEHFWRYDMPFYEYFTIKRLEPLSLPEIELLLQFWSEKKGLSEIKDYLKLYPGKIQSIRMLTDGLPRTMLIFIDMLLDRKEQNGYQYLQRVVDNATPIYQERLSGLSPSQRKVVTELAFNWDAASVEELVDKCKMESKLISAILNQLVGLRFVEKIKGETKNLYYRLEERFFNLWLNMTQGGLQQRYEAKALCSFLESWYDKTELEGLTKEFSGLLLKKQLNSDFAESLGYALLKSKVIESESKQDLVLGLRKYEAKITNEDLAIIFEDFDKSIGIAFENKDYERAIELLKISDIDEGEKFFLLGNCYFNQEQFDVSQKYYLLAIEIGHVGAVNNLAILYREQGKFDLSEKYFLSTIEKGEIKGLFNLAVLYYAQGKYDLSEKYYLSAIEKGDVQALFNLANLYSELGEYDLTEKYYLLAINKGEVKALNNLAIHYYVQGECNLCEKYFLKAIEKGDIDALDNLAKFYYMINDTMSLQKHLDSYDVSIFKDDILVYYLYLGKIEQFKEKYNELQDQWISHYILVHLLVHHQSVLVHEYFEGNTEAKEKYKPLFYTVLYLLNDKNTIKMPPEIEENVKDILKEISKKQEYYYPKG